MMLDGRFDDGGISYLNWLLYTTALSTGKH